MHDSGNEDTTRLFIGHLPEGVTDQDLLDVFGPFGALDAFLVLDRTTHQSRGFGFVRFATPEEAANALELDGIEVYGQPIAVRPALRRADDRDR